MTTTPNANCLTCNKTSFSVLLLRPSPIAKTSPMACAAMQRVASADGLVKLAPVTPARQPTESRYALRMLREGFVHVYLPTPPAGVPQWLVFRIAPSGELVPEGSAWFKQTGAAVVCTTTGHNVVGLQILTLPKATQLGTVWIAYSANLWSNAIRARNAANPKAMQSFAIGAPGPQEFKPTAAALKAHVLEYALDANDVRNADDLPFNAQSAERAESMATKLATLAAVHPKTKGHETVLVLRDPVGIQIDLNALRTRRQKLAQGQIADECKKPENEHPIQSASALDGLRPFIVDEDFRKTYTDRQKHNIMTRAQFDQIESQVNPVVYTDGPPQWIPLDDTPENLKAYGPGRGLRTLPGYEEQMREFAQAASARTWSRMQDFYDDAKLHQWMADFDKRMQAQYAHPVGAWEIDWWSVRQDASFADYFALHFDDTDPNDPHAFQSPGLAFAAEVTRSMTPQPMTQDATLDSYLDELMKPPTDPTALLWRALVGNQGELLPKLQDIVTAEITASGTFSQDVQVDKLADKVGASDSHPFAYIDHERFDKLYDFGKGVLALTKSPSNPNAIQSAFLKYGWLKGGWGELMMRYGVSVWSGMMAVSCASNVFRASKWAVNTQASKKLAARVLNATLVQMTLERAFKVSVRGGELVVPMLIGVQYPAQDAKRQLRARGTPGQLKPGKVRASGNTMVELYLLTDSAELARFNNDIDRAIAKGAGTLALSGNAAAFKTAPGKLPGVISRDTFENLMSVRTGISTVNEAWFESLDGRLAVVGVLVNLFAIKKSIGEVREEQTGTEEERKRKHNTAVLGLLDAIGGTLGAGAEMLSTLSEEVIARRARTKALAAGKNAAAAAEEAEEAVKVSGWMARMRFGGALLGLVGGVFAVVSDARKAKDAKAAGQDELVSIYYAAALAFSGTVGTTFATSAGAFAEAVLANQAKSALARQTLKVISKEALGRTAARLGAEGTLELIGLSIPGIGWLCLAAALGFEVWAYMRTPTALQTWVSRSYFGKGTGTDSEHTPFPKGQWKVEHDALMQVMNPTKPEEGKEKAEKAVGEHA